MTDDDRSTRKAGAAYADLPRDVAPEWFDRIKKRGIAEERERVMGIVDAAISEAEKERGPVLSRGPYLAALDVIRAALSVSPASESHEKTR